MKDVNYQLDECPVQKILNLFQRKWNLRIIYELSKHESMRFGELKKAVLDIFSLPYGKIHPKAFLLVL